MIKNLKTNGIFLAFMASVISGIAIFYSKISVAKIDPLILTTSRNLIAGLLCVMCYMLYGKKQEIKILKKEQWLKLFMIGLIGGALPFYLFFTGLQFVKAPIANLIHKSLFIWVGLIATVFLKEKLNIKYWISFALILIANFYFAKLPLNWGRGELMILTATLLWSIENVLAKKILKDISSELIGLFRMGIGSLILLTIVFTTKKSQALLSINNQQLVIIIIGGSILFGYVYCWYRALKYAPASLVTLVLTFSLVVGNILNGLFSGVKLLPKDIYSSIIITFATILILLDYFLKIVIPNLFRNLKDPEINSG